MREFKTWLGTIWSGVKTAIGTVKTKIVNVFTAALKWVEDKWSGLEDTLTGPWDALKGAIDAVSDAIDTLIGWIGKIHFPSVPGWVDRLNPFTKSAPASAAGTSVTSRGLGAAVPIRRGTAAAGAGITINVNGALDPESVARQIQRIMAGHDRRMGLKSA
jgi:phage-related protein